MRKIIFFILLVGIANVFAQTQNLDGIKPNLAYGEVTAVNPADSKISLKTKDGDIDAILSAKTIFKRVPPENPSLKTAVDSSISEIGIGDKILVTGLVADDKKSLPAKAVYLMTKGDISKKLTKEQEDWKLRGISGKVKALNPATKEITVTTKSLMGDKDVVVALKEKVIFRRYAPDSVKFSDSKVSKYEEVNVGDQMRALGDKSTDGLKYTAEEVLSGSFQMVGGKITAIDIAKQEVTIMDMTTKKPVTIVVNASSLMKKFPAEMAAMLAMRASGGMPQGPGGTGMQGGTVTVRPPNQTPTAGAPSGTPGGPPTGGQGGGFQRGGGQGGGRGEVDDMLERFPTISLADLKIGDAVAASSASSVGQNKVTAIKFVSGIEAFLNAPQAAGGGRGRGGQGGADFNIPGLDGFGF